MLSCQSRRRSGFGTSRRDAKSSWLSSAKGVTTTQKPAFRTLKQKSTSL